MAENYICINGKKAELTKEQLKQLGIEVPKANPFARMGCNEDYYFIDDIGEICKTCDTMFEFDNNRFEIANYCTDKTLMEQRALHETLNRLLWRYSMEHEGDKIYWQNCHCNYKIARHRANGKFFVDFNDARQDVSAVYFNTQEIAEDAIKEIVKPFMAEHPEFKW